METDRTTDAGDLEGLAATAEMGRYGTAAGLAGWSVWDRALLRFPVLEDPELGGRLRCLFELAIHAPPLTRSTGLWFDYADHHQLRVRGELIGHARKNM